MSESLDDTFGNNDPMFAELDKYCGEYEWFAAGGTDIEPGIEAVPEHQREQAISYARFLVWKYSDGLWESVHRHSSDPEYFRSQFRLIQGDSPT